MHRSETEGGEANHFHQADEELSASPRSATSASRVIPFRNPNSWVPIGDLVAAVVMRCRDRITVIERSPPEPGEGGGSGGCD